MGERMSGAKKKQTGKVDINVTYNDVIRIPLYGAAPPKEELAKLAKQIVIRKITENPELLEVSGIFLYMTGADNG